MRLLLAAAFLLAGCIAGPTSSPAASMIYASPAATATAIPAACTPTDQDAFVYSPTRLVVLSACIRMTGTVAAIRPEADGDFHILVAPDPAYAHLVNAANSGMELGDLVVEPVCELAHATQADAVAACAADKDPVSVAGLAVGEHVWMEGRWVSDSDHGGWLELHPLFAWDDLAS